MENQVKIEVAENRYDEFLNELKKINKRLNKTGFPDVEIVGKEACRKVIRDEGGFSWEFGYYEITIEYPVAVAEFAEGYQLVGVIDLSNGITFSVGENEIPLHYFENQTNVCEHCNKKRFRNEIFVVKDKDGNFIQFGKNCMQEYLPMHVKAYLYAASKMPKLREEFGLDEDGMRFGGGRIGSYISLSSAIAVAKVVVNKFGYKKSHENFWSTKDHVWDIFFGRNPHTREENGEIWKEANSDENLEYAKKVIDFFRNHSGESNYIITMKQLFANEDFDSSKYMGFVVSAIPTYFREMEKTEKDAAKAKKQENLKNEYVGEVGEKFQLPVTFNGAHFVYVNYFNVPTYVTTFITEDGNTIVYFGKDISNEYYWGLEEGQSLILSGKVKEHKEYKGTKQTVINYPKKVEPKVAK